MMLYHRCYRLLSPGLFLLLVLLPLLWLPNASRAENLALSAWMQNLSEDDPAHPANEQEDMLQLARTGDVVHVVWRANTRYYHKRSTDGGASFTPRQVFYETDQPVGNDLPYVAVSGAYVHVVIKYNTKLVYLRSTDDGSTWEAPRILVSLDNGWGLQHALIKVRGSEVMVAVSSGIRLMDGTRGSSIVLHVSNDNGITWRATPVVHSDVHNGFGFADMLVSAAHVCVLYVNSDWNNGLVFGEVFLACANDTLTSFTSYLISTPTGDGIHRSLALHDHHYAPKLSSSGEHVYAVWYGEDANRINRVFFRRSTDGGSTFDDVLNLTPDDPPVSYQNGQELVVAGGSHVYVVFLGPQGVLLRRSADAGATFEPAQLISAPPNTPLIAGGWWPEVNLDPRDPTGATLHIGWYPAVSVWSKDGGATFEQLTMLDPVFSRWNGNVSPDVLLDENGIVHMVFGYVYQGGSDSDVFYRRLLPPAPRAATNQALRLVNAPADYRHDTLAVPASPDNQQCDALTVEAWVRPAAGAAAANGAIVHKVDMSGNSQGYMLRLSSNKPLAVLGTASAQYDLLGDIVLSPNVWSHLAMTFDSSIASDNYHLYVNGMRVATGTIPEPLICGAGMLLIGGYVWTGSFSGDIDEVRLWNRARTEAEIRATLFATLRGDEAGLTAYYPMDGTPADATGHGNDGLLLYHEQFVPLTTAPRPGALLRVAAETGGTLRVFDRGLQIELQVPAQATATTMLVSYTGLLTVPQPLPAEHIGVAAFELAATDEAGQVITQFAPSLTLVLHYNDEQLAALGIDDPARLRILYWNGQQWEPVRTNIDTLQQQVRGTLDHFSPFALTAAPSSTSLFVPLIRR